MKTIIFEERYFKNIDEWEWFLYSIGVNKEDYSNISEVTIKIDSDAIKLDYWIDEDNSN